MVEFLKSNYCSEYCSEYLRELLEQNPIPEVNFWGRIPPKQLTRLSFWCIILRCKGRQDRRDTPEFKQSIIRFLRQVLGMNQFNVKGDLGRHFLSISGASAECGISTSTINRSAGKTFPPKRKVSEGRVGFWVFQIVEWLQGKRGGWN